MKQQQLPTTKEGWEAYLASSVEAGHKLTPEELALVLYYFDAIEVGSFSNLVAHNLYPGLPDCPVFFDPRRLSEENAGHLGEHLGLDFRSCTHSRSKEIAVAGIPRAGSTLARGFFRGLGNKHAILLEMRQVKEPTGFELEEVPGHERTLVIVDFTSATGTTAERAVKASPVRVSDVVVLVNREEGASQLLGRLEPRVMLLPGIRLRGIVTYLEHHGKVRAGTELALARYRHAVLTAQQEILARGGT